MTGSYPPFIRQRFKAARSFVQPCETRIILAELLQNARQAGASHIHIGVRPDPDTTSRLQIAVADDGDGIDHPQHVLSFGSPSSTAPKPRSKTARWN